MALITVANKLVRQAFAVIKSDSPYVDGFVSTRQTKLLMVEFFLSFYLQINIVRYLFVSGVRVITAWKTNCDLKSINFYQTDVFLILYALEINLIISIL